MLVEKQLNINLELNQKRKENLTKIKKSLWEINIETEIETMRWEMFIFSETDRNKDPQTRKARKVIIKYKITNVIDIPSIKEELKQTIQVKAQKERRFDTCCKFYRQNKFFQTDPKKF